MKHCLIRYFYYFMINIIESYVQYIHGLSILHAITFSIFMTLTSCTEYDVMSKIKLKNNYMQLSLSMIVHD